METVCFEIQVWFTCSVWNHFRSVYTGLSIEYIQRWRDVREVTFMLLLERDILLLEL